MMNYFREWHNIKEKVHQRKNLPNFKEGEIWWCNLGLNVGHETDGKSSVFTRPVLVIRKFSRHTFWGIPLTTKIKNNPYYFEFIFKEKNQCSQLSQLKLFSANRLLNSLGKIPQKLFEEIKTKTKSLL
jgi:mRNA interferase MazF